MTTTSAIVLMIAVLVWQRRQWQVQAALAEVPEIETERLEPGMSQIIGESRAALESNPFSDKAWGKHGMVLLAQDFVSEAVACFARAEQFCATDFQWPYLRGLSLERLEPEVAMQCFRRASELRKDLVIPKIRLAEMLLSREQLDEAELLLRQAVRQAPREPRVLLGLGRLAFLRRQADEAWRWTSDAAQLDPQNRQIHLLMCQIHQHRGDEDALQEHLQILETIPETNAGNEWPDPYLAEVVSYKRGTMWTLQVATQQIFAGQIAKAIALLEQSGGKDAKDARIVVLLGKAYLRSEQLELAEQALKRAVELDSQLAPAHFELGNLAMVAGRWNDAASHYRETIRLQPDLAAAHYNLGLYHQFRGEHDDAVAAFKQAIQYMPGNFPAHREMAEVLLELGRVNEAIENLKTASRLMPHDVKLQALMDRAQLTNDTLP